jgi:flavin reductase (DIM6/NTAB) family NADH-FMN oxidoreductase RutF
MSNLKKSIGPRTMAFPTPVWVVGTYDQDGKPNAMTAAWASICCSKPPAIGVSLRKATYSYGNIVQHQAFTISVPSEAHVREADYLGMATGKEVNKFNAARLTPVASTLVDAPYVAEFPLVLECRVIHTLEIGLHTLFIGEILDVKADEHVLGEKGFPDIEKVRPIVFGPEIRTYHGIGKLLGQAFAIGRDLM